MVADVVLDRTPFLVTGDLATVAPAWVRELFEGEGEQAAARAWFDAHPAPVIGPAHEVDGVRMLEVSFLDWAQEHPERPRYLLLGGLHAKRRGDLDPFVMRSVANTPLVQATYLLPADGIYSYAISTPDPAVLDEATGMARLDVLFDASRVDERNPARLPANDLSVWQGPDFPAHPILTDQAPVAADDVDHLTVTHPDGRARDVWVHRAPSGTAHTVVLFDGDTWHDLGVGAAVWDAAGYDANLVLMSSMAAADRTPDLTDHERAAATLQDVLDAVSQLWGLTLAPDDVVLVGQSFGGLAVVGVVLQHPDLASSGVCISGSFFFVPGQPLPQDLDQIGIHRRALEQLHDPAGRIVMLSGRDEPIADQSLAYLAEARDHDVDVAVFRHLRGTHDHAWWRHAIFHGLDALLSS